LNVILHCCDFVKSLKIASMNTKNCHNIQKCINPLTIGDNSVKL
jgi:hypothetical protein